MKLPTDDDSNVLSMAIVPFGWILIMIRQHTANILKTRVFLDYFWISYKRNKTYFLQLGCGNSCPYIVLTSYSITTNTNLNQKIGLNMSLNNKYTWGPVGPQVYGSVTFFKYPYEG